MKLRTILEDGRPARKQDAWDLFSDFGPRDKQPKPPKVVKTQPPRTIPYHLDLYRGFDADLDSLEQRDGGLVLSPRKSEQGLIWFTHKLINGYNPIEYVTGRGEYLLTYPLDCVRHVERKIYDDGSYYDAIPQVIQDVTDPTSNCKFYMGIELPEGWIFSYKMEKFIGCGIEILVSPDMITRQ
jgi:hypothetical protein